MSSSSPPSNKRSYDIFATSNNNMMVEAMDAGVISARRPMAARSNKSKIDGTHGKENGGSNDIRNFFSSVAASAGTQNGASPSFSAVNKRVKNETNDIKKVKLASIFVGQSKKAKNVKL
ncbi:MAG: hypothetical protein SGILL_003149, partial [Bacillariaceae sp.]